MRNPQRIVYNLNVIRNALPGLTAIHSRLPARRHHPQCKTRRKVIQPIKIMTSNKLKLPKTGSKDAPRQNYKLPAPFVLAAVVFACFSPRTNQAYAQEQKQKVIY